MARAIDVSLLKKIKQHGAGANLDVSACFSCGNCTVVCPLAAESGDFPRRMIRRAQIGMEEEILASEEIWRCYACGECTETCPRQADPAGFMAALRSYAIARYDFTGIAGLASRSVAGSLLVFTMFSIVFALLLLGKQGQFSAPTPMFSFIPGEWIHLLGVALFLVVGLSMALSVASMTRRFLRQQAGKGVVLQASDLPGALFEAIRDVFLHERFRQCEQTSEERIGPTHSGTKPWLAHAAVIGGFLAMLVATTLDYLLKPIGSPVPPWYPMRVLGTLGGIVCLWGLGVMLHRRWKAQDVPWKKSAPSDWLFLLLLAATVFTGLVAEISVYLPASVFTHLAFFVHVVLAMDLVALLPLTKFAHAMLRTVALGLHAWRSKSTRSEHTAGAEA